MISMISKPPISRAQKRAALLVAAGVDFLQLIALPALGLGLVLDDFLDFAAALFLTAICGFKWRFALAFFLELIPFLDVLPTWTAVVALLPAYDLAEQEQRLNVSVAHRAPPPFPSRPSGDFIDVEAKVVDGE